MAEAYGRLSGVMRISAFGPGDLGPTVQGRRSKGRYGRHRRGRRITAVVALLLAVVAAGAAIAWSLSGQADPDPADAADRFVAAWSRGDDAGAARLTDRPGQAAAALEANRAGLDGATLTRARPRRPRGGRRHGDRADGLAWEVPGIGAFAYRSSMRLRQGRGPLGRRLVAEGRASQLDEVAAAGHDPRAGAARQRCSTATAARSSSPRTVYRVGLARDKVENIDGDRSRRSPQVVDVDGAPTRGRSATPARSSSSRRSRSGEADYKPLARRLEPVPGVLAVRGEAPLRPSREFARALLGTRRPGDRRAARGARRRVRGPATRSASPACRPPTRSGWAARPRARSCCAPAGAPVETLLTRAGRQGRPLRRR